MLFSNLTAAETFLVFGVVFWPLFLLVAVLMAGLALTAWAKGRPWLAGLYAIVAVVILLPVLLDACLTWQDWREQQQRDALRQAHRWTLTQTQTGGGVLRATGLLAQCRAADA